VRVVVPLLLLLPPSPPLPLVLLLLPLLHHLPLLARQLLLLLQAPLQGPVAVPSTTSSRRCPEQPLAHQLQALMQGWRLLVLQPAAGLARRGQQQHPLQARWPQHQGL
jgi:hypothetical protein